MSLACFCTVRDVICAYRYAKDRASKVELFICVEEIITL